MTLPGSFGAWHNRHTFFFHNSCIILAARRFCHHPTMDKSTNKPVFLYDGDCKFCRRWILKWNLITGDKVKYEPYQGNCSRYGLAEDDCKRAVQFVDGSRRFSAAEAVFRSLATASKARWLLGLYQYLPGFAAVSELLYRIVAANRPFFSRLTPAASKNPQKKTFLLSRWLYLRGLGIVFFLAFASLGTQLDGLISSNGILPAAEFLDALSRRLGPERFYLLPTLGWVNTEDWFLQFLCSSGVVASALVFFGILTVPALTVCWVLYLSFISISRDFLSFQWDILLLEAGFIGIFLSPLHVFPEPLRNAAPSKSVHFLAKWLLFRLMFLSGAVKLASGDPVWHDLTALSFHYETQPLPQALSWYLHSWPAWFHSVTTAFVLFMELVVPFFILGPRALRLLAAKMLIFFQIVIFLTGNYGFFNILTVLLCFMLIDDAAWPQWLSPRNENSGKTAHAVKTPKGFSWPGMIVFPLAVYLFTLSLVPFCTSLGKAVSWPGFILKSYETVSPFHLANGYGLFAVMTTVRDEITVQGSRDGIRWENYEFRYKPGELKNPPHWVAPHQPRLDWQLWFAALQPVGEQPWFTSFCYRLLTGSDSVERLLAANPFAGRPPKFVRALIYRYKFTTPSERAATGNYWKSSDERVYLPPVSLPANGSS